LTKTLKTKLTLISSKRIISSISLCLRFTT
jgi:hypothetical protein